MDSNIVVAIISAIASITTAVIAARGKRSKEPDGGYVRPTHPSPAGYYPPPILIEKRGLSLGWRVVLWAVAGLFCYVIHRQYHAAGQLSARSALSNSGVSNSAPSRSFVLL